jgi:hypothetical protein
MPKGFGERAIARSLGLGKATVGGYLARARQAGLLWPLAPELDDDSLELLLFPSPTMASRLDRPVPDWAVPDWAVPDWAVPDWPVPDWPVPD